MAGGHVAIRANPSADLGVIVAGMAIVVAGLVIVVVAAVTDGVEPADRCGKCACYGLAKPFPGGRVARVARRDERYTLPFGFSLPPSLRFRFATVSLRLGHGSALTVPRTVIHSLAAASLPRQMEV